MTKNETLAHRLQELAEKENVILEIKFDGSRDSIATMVLYVTYGDKHIKAAYDGYELELVRLFGINPEHDDYIVEVFTNLIERVKAETENDKKKFDIGDLVMVNYGVYKNRVGRIVEECLDGTYRVGLGHEGGWFETQYLDALDLANDGLYIKEV